MHPLIRRSIALSLLSALVGSGLALAGSSGWEKVSDEDGISVYQRHEANSKILGLRGEATIGVTPQVLFDVMKDNAEAAEWVPLVTERRDLKAVSATERIELTHVSPPWPVADRYFINSGRVEYLPDGGLRLSVKSVPVVQIEPSWRLDGMILGELLYSEFLLLPVDGGRHTHVTLEVQTDPKGLIPKWVVNFAQRSWPRDFFNGLNAHLKRKGLMSTEPVAH